MNDTGDFRERLKEGYRDHLDAAGDTLHSPTSCPECSAFTVYMEGANLRDELFRRRLEAEARKSLQAAMKQCDDLFELGFTQDRFGQFRATGCTVVFYPVGGEVEVDIVLPNGSAVRFDVPARAIKGAKPIVAG
jgi:hypothetical protein